MNYQKIYLLSLVGIGLVFSIQSLPTLATEPSLPVILTSIGGVGMMIAGGYDLFLSDDSSAPTEPNGQFLLVVLGFVLSTAGVVITLVA